MAGCGVWLVEVRGVCCMLRPALQCDLLCGRPGPSAWALSVQTVNEVGRWHEWPGAYMRSSAPPPSHVQLMSVAGGMEGSLVSVCRSVVARGGVGALYCGFQVGNGRLGGWVGGWAGQCLQIELQCCAQAFKQCSAARLCCALPSRTVWFTLPLPCLPCRRRCWATCWATLWGSPFTRWATGAPLRALPRSRSRGLHRGPMLIACAL